MEYPTEPFLPSEEDIMLARETTDKLAQYSKTQKPLQIILQDADGTDLPIELPASAFQLLIDILEQMASGNAFTLTSLQTELTTNQAAELLKVSRPFLIKLLENGEIPFRKVGSHRRILAKDVLLYKQTIFEKRSKVLDEMTAQAEELNLGYD